MKIENFKSRLIDMGYEVVKHTFQNWEKENVDVVAIEAVNPVKTSMALLKEFGSQYNAYTPMFQALSMASIVPQDFYYLIIFKNQPWEY